MHFYQFSCKIRGDQATVEAPANQRVMQSSILLIPKTEDYFTPRYNTSALIIFCTFLQKQFTF